MKKQKILPLILLPMLVFCFLSVTQSTLSQVDTSILTMQGKDWYIKVDQQLQTETVTTAPYVAVTKQGQEKELFLQINDIKETALGIVEFKVETSGLTVYKQLPLNVELADSKEYSFVNATHALDDKGNVKIHRPIEVVNSFACFNSDGKKVLHIYASKLVDAKGDELWVDSDLKEGLLTVYLDAKWLETATYPIIVDPTFGYTDIGGTSDNVNGYGRFFMNNLSETGLVNSISCYFLVTTGTPYARVAIYDSVAGTPTNLIVESASEAVTNGTWHEFSITETELEAGTYFLANQFQSGASIRFDFVSVGSGFKSMSYGAYPDPLTSPTMENNKACSIYATYDLPPTPTPTPSPSPSPTPPPAPQETDSTLNLVILLCCLGLAILLMAWNKLPLLNFVFGMFIIGIAAYSLTINLYAGGLLQLVVIIIGVLCMYSGYREAV